MNDIDTTMPDSYGSATGRAARSFDRFCRSMVHRRISGIQTGQLVLIDDEGRHQFGHEAQREELAATVSVRDPRFYRYMALGGAVGAADAYIQGYWTCDDLTILVRLLVRNRHVLQRMDKGPGRIVGPLLKILHGLNRNTRAGSRRNIAAHYDLGNEFFSLWLDSTMMYSSAVFESADMTLEAASIAKLDRICRKLELSPNDHVLEIGTGWGGFAVYAAAEYGCRVTTTTISKEQYEHASERIRRAGLEDRVTLLLQDYRDLDGEFDKLVSIEMIEAVGADYLDTYFERCSRLLKADGMMLLQAITIADQRYKHALKSVDFIQRYIFPGGFLPSVTAMQSSISASTNLRMYHLEDIGQHYALTLNRWRTNFLQALTRIRSIGFSDEFLRMWHYYYCYCEGAFVERAIGNVQMLLVKPNCRRAPVIGPLPRAS